MDTYNVQSYFKSLCNSYYIAYKQFERFKNDKQSKDYDFWRERIYNCQQELKSIIEDIEFNKISIIVSTKEEVFALIWLYTKPSYCNYNVVNINEEAERAYPMDDLWCQYFWEEYPKCGTNRATFLDILRLWVASWN